MRHCTSANQPVLRLAGLGLVLGLACVPACGDDGGDGSGDPADAAPPGELMLRGACSTDQRLGGFLVEVQPMFSVVAGDVSNGVVPATIPELVATEGDCQLLRKRNPFCDPPCQAGLTCDFDGSCIAFPEKQDVGVVTIEGLAADVVMEPLDPTNDYFSLDVPHPAFTPGAEIRLSSTDGFYGRLELAGVGSDVLELTDDKWTVQQGAALSVSWQPPETEVDSRILLRLNIDQHGNTPVTVQCDFDDDGSGTIPATAIDMLIQLGISGFPNGTLVRRTADSQQVSDGCVELTVGSPQVSSVEVTGHTPCVGPMDCTPPQVCDLPTQTCVDP